MAAAYEFEERVMKSNHFEQDFKRYIDGKGMPKFQKYFRKSQDAADGFLKTYYRFLFAHYKKKTWWNCLQTQRLVTDCI